ncbi:hypothetical protein CONLIGDRAFT_632044 [Coniochaeta ligniaria NRRL 30616]|uniref:Uncharacterized protein n=1 Tax=Coniochaeta ligniaria NRRL 30616 TaxID=1408157 RepID=A0A1J7IR50_9PEZI|nr:hypothetical protein CONLIGDRAFT_632044 [Coniochaeta ligniaria NRRL 30616]
MDHYPYVWQPPPDNQGGYYVAVPGYPTAPVYPPAPVYLPAPVYPPGTGSFNPPGTGLALPLGSELKKSFLWPRCLGSELPACCCIALAGRHKYLDP